MDDHDDHPEPESGPPAPAAAAGATADGADRGESRPFYRRGTVWAWFVLVSAVGAWLLAGVAEDRVYAFDPGPDEVAAVCPAAAPLQEVAAWGDLSRGQPIDGDRLAALDELAAVAPGTIVDDVRELRAAEEERQALLVGVDLGDPVEKPRARDAVDRLADEHRVALQRVDAYVEAACGYPVLVGIVTLG